MKIYISDIFCAIKNESFTGANYIRELVKTDSRVGKGRIRPLSYFCVS